MNLIKLFKQLHDIMRLKSNRHHRSANLRYQKAHRGHLAGPHDSIEKTQVLNSALVSNTLRLLRTPKLEELIIQDNRFRLWLLDCG